MLAIFKRKTPAPIQELPKKELINSCSKCSMEKFVDCLVNGNTHVVDDWNAIFNEYLDITGDTNVAASLELVKSITMIQNKLVIIQLCIDELKRGHSESLAERLRSLGFRFDYKDDETLQQDLERTVTKAKALLIQLKQEKAELDEIRSQDAGEATNQDYEMQYSAIGEFLGCFIDPKIYTVARYCADIKRINQRSQQQAT